MSLQDALNEARRRSAPPPLPGSRSPHATPKGPPALPPPQAKLLTGASRILAPQELHPLENLLLFARQVVQGWFAGKHRSLDFGSNAEFAEHKPYVPGDPVQHFDWHVYARSRRLVVRRHRDEKDLTAHLVVDVSGSMAYTVKGRDGKLLRAARLAASLAYLMHRQGDKFGLHLFNEGLVRTLAPGGTRRHLYDLVGALEHGMARPGGRTAVHGALDQCVPLCPRRGCLVVISDFFTDLDRFLDAVAQFQHRRFKVLLLHVADPDELHLPDVPLARFVDMETGDAVQVAPDEIRLAYRRQMEAMHTRLSTEARNRGLEYHLLATNEPYLQALEAWLGLRGRVKHAGGPAT